MKFLITWHYILIIAKNFYCVTTCYHSQKKRMFNFTVRFELIISRTKM